MHLGSNVYIGISIKEGGFLKWLIRSVKTASAVVLAQRVVPQVLSQRVMASTRSMQTLV
jgi:hypothetical protein